jgi:hypothetical protein
VTSGRDRQVAAGTPRRLLHRAVPAAAAVLITGGVVAMAVAHGPAVEPVRAAAAITPVPKPAVTVAASGSPDREDRSVAVSRSAKRVTLQPKPKVTGREFMTAPLNLWPAPREKGRPLAVLPKGGKAAITGVQRAAFAQILYDGQVRWVKKAYLADRMPEPRPEPRSKPEPAARPAATSPKKSAETSGRTGSAAGVSSSPCPDGSGTESGLTPSAVTLFRSVCNAFPALTTYGGYDAHGEHSSGKAIDFMVSDSSLGQAVADWARAHASELNLYDVIWAQHIWTPVRASEGWRSMPDRGSSTANHYDHVHIAVN